MRKVLWTIVIFLALIMIWVVFFMKEQPKKTSTTEKDLTNGNSTKRNEETLKVLQLKPAEIDSAMIEKLTYWYGILNMGIPPQNNEPDNLLGLRHYLKTRISDVDDKLKNQ